MLKKKQKIRRAMFGAIVSRGAVFHAPHFTMRVSKRTEKEPSNSLFSFVISKKVAGKATERNLLKRRGYVILRNQYNNITQGYRGVFFFKKSSLHVSFKELEQEIIFLLKKSHLFHV